MPHLRHHLRLWRPLCGALVHLRCHLHPLYSQLITWVVRLRRHPCSLRWVRLRRPARGALVHLRCHLHPLYFQFITWVVCLRHHPWSLRRVRLRRPARGALVHLRCHLHPLYFLSLRWVRLRRPARGALVHLRCHLHPLFCPCGGFAFGAQSAELWFTSGAISTLSIICGGFAFGAQSAELWFTFGAISTTTTTLVEVPAQPPPHRHLREVSGWLPWSKLPNVLDLLRRKRESLQIILYNNVILYNTVWFFLFI